MPKEKQQHIELLIAALNGYKKELTKKPAGKDGKIRLSQFETVLKAYQASSSDNLTDICKFYQQQKITKWNNEPRLIIYLRYALYKIFKIEKPPLPEINCPQVTLAYQRAKLYAQIAQQEQMKSNLETSMERYIKGTYSPPTPVTTKSMPSSEIELGGSYISV